MGRPFNPTVPGHSDFASRSGELSPFIRYYEKESDHSLIVSGSEFEHPMAPKLSEYHLRRQRYAEGQYPPMFIRPLSWLSGCTTILLIARSPKYALELEYARDINFDWFRNNYSTGCRGSVLLEGCAIDQVPESERQAVLEMNKQSRLMVTSILEAVGNRGVLV